MIHAALTVNMDNFYADIWKVGVNLPLRIGDLLILKYADLNLEERTLKRTEIKISSVE